MAGKKKSKSNAFKFRKVKLNNDGRVEQTNRQNAFIPNGSGYHTLPGTIIATPKTPGTMKMVLCCSTNNINKKSKCIAQDIIGRNMQSGYIRRYNIPSNSKNSILQKVEIGGIYTRGKGIIVYKNFTSKIKYNDS